jgi:hypothetical protein
VSKLHNGRLVLTPSRADLVPKSTGQIIDRLQDIGFIAERIQRTSNQYLAGEAFLSLIDFLGCSPSIRLKPSLTGEPYCHMVVLGPYEQPHFLHGRNTKPPHCEQCRKRMSHWEPLITAWRDNPNQYRIQCPHCAHRQSPMNCHWRHNAGFGRYLLLVENIFPHEAIPSPCLMKQLQAACQNHPWNHFYIQDG